QRRSEMHDRLMEGGAVLFVGVGAMGEPMAARLAQAGFDLAISDLDSVRTTTIAERLGVGVVAHGDLAESAARFGTLVSMLPSSAVVESVLLDGSGVLDVLAPGSVIIDMSSSAPSSTVRLSAAATARGVGYLDAP